MNFINMKINSLIFLKKSAIFKKIIFLNIEIFFVSLLFFNKFKKNY